MSFRLSADAPAVEQYLALGFTAVETGSPDCVGLRAGGTYLILVSADYMAGDFQPATVARLVGRTVPYIYVSSVAAAKERLSAAAFIVEQVVTRGGTMEAVVEQGHQYLLLAEKGADAP